MPLLMTPFAGCCNESGSQHKALAATLLFINKHYMHILLRIFKRIATAIRMAAYYPLGVFNRIGLAGCPIVLHEACLFLYSQYIRSIFTTIWACSKAVAIS